MSNICRVTYLKFDFFSDFVTVGVTTRFFIH